MTTRRPSAAAYTSVSSPAQQYPPPPYAPRGVTGTAAVRVTAGVDPSAAATTRSTRPPNASSQASRAPPGDQRASPKVRERATAVAEIAVIRPRLTSAATGAAGAVIPRIPCPLTSTFDRIGRRLRDFPTYAVAVRESPHRLVGLPGQSPLRRPGGVHPLPRPGADRARPPGDGVLGPAVPRAGPAGAARSGSPASTSTGRRTRSGCRGRGSSRPPSTCGSSPSCARPGFPEPWTFSRARPAPARPPPGRLRPHPRQPVPRLGPARADGRRLAGAGHPAPPDHRRPRPRPRARHERVAALHAAALVRVPRDADAGGAGDPAHRHGVGVEPARHRAADGCARGPAAHRARRRRPADLPPHARRSRACRAAS